MRRILAAATAPSAKCQSAALLRLTGGPPRSPAGILDADRLEAVLTSSSLAAADVAAVAITAGWVALGYLAFSIILRFLVASLASLAGGATWTASALRASDLLTLPVVRRAIDGALAGVLLGASWLPPMMAGRASAVAEPVPVVALHRPAAHPLPAAPVARPGTRPDADGGYVEYALGRGEYLWAVAQRLYGDGSRWTEIFEANRGRVMTDGTRLVDPNRLEVGWRLRIPLPARHLEARDGVAMRYQVRLGDSLWAIAERLLADGFRWTELWDLNGGREMPGGRRFVDPDLILPGWWLNLPATGIETPAAAAAPQLEPEPAVPVTPEAAPDPAEESGGATPRTESDSGVEREWEWRSVVRPVVFTAAGFALVGGAVILVRRLPPISWATWPAARRGRGGGLGDAGRVTMAARAVQVALADLGFGDVRPLFAIEEGERLEFALRCPPGDADALVGARHELGRRLACRVDAELIGSTRVTLCLQRFRRLAALLLESAPDPPPLLVPVGAGDEGIVYLDLGSSGTTTVVGDLFERRAILGDWLATLQTAHSPESVTVRCDTSMAAMLGEEPQLAGGGTTLPTAELLAELEEIVLTRDEDAAAARPIVSLVNGDGAMDGRLEALGRRGPAVGVYLVTGESGEAAGGRRVDGTTVRLTGAGESVEDDEAGAPDILLELPRGERLSLDPVRVRVDESAYWREATSASPTFDAAAASDGTEPDVGRGLEPASDQGLEDLPDDGERDETLEDEPEIAADPDLEPIPTSPASLPTAVLADEESPAAASAAPGSALAVPRPRADSAPLAVRQTTLLLDKPEDGDLGTRVTQVLVRCLGPLEVECAGTLIEHWRVQKSRELLAFLVSRGGSVAREVVMEALWPEEEPKRCAQLLHTAAHYLRRALREASGEGAAFVVSASGRYRLEPGRFRVDLDLFEDHLRRAHSAGDAAGLDEIERAVQLYRGEFVQGEPYEWAEAFRVDFAARFAAAARVAGHATLTAGDTERARALFERVLALDATDEEAARGLMRVYAATHNGNGARKVYRALTEALRRELDDEAAEPAAETSKLLTELSIAAC
ncbi:MAG: LysM peptidoglycan-binding domain-containing protein [Dehalococcoidia bacterium]|nr:LysM peptidoglycan-binding domain-containing protein [Dehalococcoidia bacterium]